MEYDSDWREVLNLGQTKMWICMKCHYRCQRTQTYKPRDCVEVEKARRLKSQAMAAVRGYYEESKNANH